MLYLGVWKVIFDKFLVVFSKNDKIKWFKLYIDKEVLLFWIFYCKVVIL